jgi:predicted  nucleic acid-binding Zn-ribbon protein
MQWFLEHATHSNAMIVLLCVMIVLTILNRRRVNKMATAQEVHDLVAQGVQAVKDHLDQTAARVTDRLSKLTQAIADLQAKLDAAGTQADFSDVQSALKDLQTEADNIAPESA